MNNKIKTVADKSAPYRSLGINKISAPTKAQNEPKARVIKGESDLRFGGKKA
jgi:hypothetical protein